MSILQNKHLYLNSTDKDFEMNKYNHSVNIVADLFICAVHDCNARECREEQLSLDIVENKR
jgi:hypothetical protein